MNPFANCLQKCNVQSISEIKKEIFCLNSNQNINDAIEMMAKHKMISLPVVDAQSKKCCGVVELADILRYFFSGIQDPEKLKENELKNLEINGKYIGSDEVCKAVEKSGRPKYTPIYPETEVEKVMQLFSSGAHNIPVVDHDCKLVGMLTQHSMIRHFEKYLVSLDFKVIAEKQIEALELAKQQNICCVKPGDTVLNALNLLLKKDFSALAVVDQGKLIGNFSISDLKGFTKDQFTNFLLPVNDFLQKFSPESFKPLKCKPQDTFQNVMHRLSDRHVHRLWITDAQEKPVGAVSISDILKLIQEIRVKSK